VITPALKRPLGPLKMTLQSITFLQSGLVSGSQFGYMLHYGSASGSQVGSDLQFGSVPGSQVGSKLQFESVSGSQLGSHSSLLVSILRKLAASLLFPTMHNTIPAKTASNERTKTSLIILLNLL